MPEMVAAGASTEAFLSSAGSLFFLSYGIGQLVNGFFGDYIKGKTIISGGLIFAALVLFLFPVCVDNDKSGVAPSLLWCCCGYFLSMLWGPMTKVIAENLPGRAGTASMTLLNVASILGTMLTYGVCAVAAALDQWRAAFYYLGAQTLVGAFVSFMLLRTAEKKGLLTVKKARKADRSDKASPSVSVTKTLLAHGIIPMIFVSAMNGIIRNSVAFWVPTYIADRLSVTPEVSSLISTLLPVVNVLGTFAGLFLLGRLRGRETVTIAVLFAYSAAAFTFMNVFSGNVINLILLFTSSAAMSSACNLIFSKYCLRFSDTGRASLISGTLDFISYIAAAAANPLFADLHNAFSWNATVYVWAAVCLVGALFSVAASHKKTLRE